MPRSFISAGYAAYRADRVLLARFLLKLTQRLAEINEAVVRLGAATIEAMGTQRPVFGAFPFRPPPMFSGRIHPDMWDTSRTMAATIFSQKPGNVGDALSYNI